MKVYWWKGPHYPNVGDELSRIILEEYFNAPVEHAPIKQAELLSTGSVLGWAFNDAETERTTPLAVVGSGFMHTGVVPFSSPSLKIYSVRGYLSRNHLGHLGTGKVGLGDPGLLAGKITNRSAPEIASELGIILHSANSNNDELKKKFEPLNPRFIETRTDDLDNFAHEITACKTILSQSLHGLVVADSLGIPNAWLNLGSLHPGGSFKFFDYFSTVGREFYKFVWGVPNSMEPIRANLFYPDTRRIQQVQREIEVSFRRMLTDRDERA